MEDVGVPKTEALRRTLKRVVPWANIESVPEMFRDSEARRLICQDRRPDFVLDCIDDVNTKAELLAFCLKNGLRVVTSMGAGGKADPTKLRIGSLSDCVKDPLASKIKWKLKKHGVSPEEVTTVYSCEKPVCNLMPLDEDMAESPQDFGVADYLRLRVMPVLGTSPSVFGQSMAAYVLCSLSEVAHFEPDSCERMSKNLKMKLLKLLSKSEKKRFSAERDVDLDDEDLEFAVQTVW
jgi:tRNA A37 threonylcarbamoyladenosine dehydratase